MISVIIPCYNAASFIAETLESILSQEGEDLEVIVIDDGSTDHSALIVKALQDQRIKYIHQLNKGVSAARNHGLSLSKGEFVIFFDADDKMSKNFLSARRDLLERFNDIDFSCGPVVTFPIISPETFGVATEVAHRLLTYDVLYSSCPSNYLIRRSILIKNNVRFNERLSSTADRFFLIELAVKTKGMLIDEAPLLYRVNPNSMSNKLTQKLVLDNERYFLALRSSNLIPKEIANEFTFKIKYILGLGYLRTGLFYKGGKYALGAFLKNPGKFVKQILKN